MRLDRNYFRKKANPKAKKSRQLSKCCGQDIDRNILNKNNKDDWELIEDYCERALQGQSSLEYITPICCEVCGRLIEYISTINERAWKI